MKVLHTGATGYIGKRLLPILVEQNHEVVCCVRDRKRFNPPESMKDRIKVIEVDLLDSESLKAVPDDIDGAYYLVVTPFGLLKRLFGGRPLPLKPDRNRSSYWAERPEPAQPKERFTKRF